MTEYHELYLNENFDECHTVGEVRTHRLGLGQVRIGVCARTRDRRIKPSCTCLYIQYTVVHTTVSVDIGSGMPKVFDVSGRSVAS